MNAILAHCCLFLASRRIKYRIFFGQATAQSLPQIASANPEMDRNLILSKANISGIDANPPPPPPPLQSRKHRSQNKSWIFRAWQHQLLCAALHIYTNGFSAGNLHNAHASAQMAGNCLAVHFHLCHGIESPADAGVALHCAMAWWCRAEVAECGDKSMSGGENVHCTPFACAVRALVCVMHSVARSALQARCYGRIRAHTCASRSMLPCTRTHTQPKVLFDTN